MAASTCPVPLSASPLPINLHFLHNPNHPATAWLLWDCDANTSETAPPPPLPRDLRPDAVVGMLHNVISIGDSVDTGLPMDSFFLCQHEIPLNHTERIGMGLSVGAIHNLKECAEEARSASTGGAPIAGATSFASSSTGLPDPHTPRPTVAAVSDAVGGEGSNVYLQNGVPRVEPVDSKPPPSRPAGSILASSHAEAASGQRHTSRFVIFLLESYSYHVCLHILPPHHFIIQVHHAPDDPFAPTCEGSRVSTSCFFMYSPDGTAGDCLPPTVVPVSTRMVVCNEKCSAGCGTALADCVCQPMETLCRGLTSFRTLVERCRHSTSYWRQPQMKEADVYTARRLPNGTLDRSISHMPMWVDTHDGMSSSNMRTVVARLEFFQKCCTIPPHLRSQMRQETEFLLRQMSEMGQPKQQLQPHAARYHPHDQLPIAFGQEAHSFGEEEFAEHPLGSPPWIIHEAQLRGIVHNSSVPSEATNEPQGVACLVGSTDIVSGGVRGTKRSFTNVTRDFSCPQCPKSFGGQTALRRHLRTVRFRSSRALASRLDGFPTVICGHTDIFCYCCTT